MALGAHLILCLVCVCVCVPRADRVEFTTVGVRVSSESQPSLLPVTPLSHQQQQLQQQLPANAARIKAGKLLDMRHKAILNHAYSNPQCHLSNGDCLHDAAFRCA